MPAAPMALIISNKFKIIKNNSEDINFKQSKDEKINIYDDFDNDSEKIK